MNTPQPLLSELKTEVLVFTLLNVFKVKKMFWLMVN